MDTFLNIWKLLGNNSGQIQVILNLIVIALAFVAASYAKKQIVIAQQQRQDEIWLSKHRLKVSILEVSYNCKKDIVKLKKDFDDYEVEFSKLLENKGFKLDDIMPESVCTFKEWLKFPTDTLSRIESTNTDLADKLNKDNDESNLSINELEAILIKLMDIASSLEYSKQGLVKRLEEIRALYTTI